jgi:hypothetical protein
VEARGSRLTCRVSGDIGPFLAALGQGRVVDLTIEVPRLEEAFLGFYDEAGGL